MYWKWGWWRIWNKENNYKDWCRVWENKLEFVDRNRKRDNCNNNSYNNSYNNNNN